MKIECDILSFDRMKEVSINIENANIHYFFSRDYNVSIFNCICQGYAGHIPYGYAHFGKSNVPATNSALCDFTSDYRKRQSTEWAPVTVSRPDPPLMIQPTTLYHKHVGMLPNYLGHVPGETFRYLMISALLCILQNYILFQYQNVTFRFGKTFGADTKDAKRWLRGNFSV